MCGWDGDNPGNDGNDISVIPGSYRQNKERGEVTIVRQFTTMMVISSLSPYIRSIPSHRSKHLAEGEVKFDEYSKVKLVGLTLINK